jgi:hypothetical protein
MSPKSIINPEVYDKYLAGYAIIEYNEDLCLNYKSSDLLKKIEKSDNYSV